jgi:hypothetical protein
MTNFSRFVTFALLVLLVGCAVNGPATTPATPTAPTPPQITVANAVNALAQAVDGAVTAAIAARDQGKCSQVDLNAIEAFAAVLANTGKRVDAELRSADDWPTQKVKIVQLVSAAGLSTLKAKISPGAQILVVSLVTIADQISSAVGGPTI